MYRVCVVEYTDHWTTGGEESYITKLIAGLDHNIFDVRILTGQKETDLYDTQLINPIDMKSLSIYSLMSEVSGNPILRAGKTLPLFRKYLKDNPCDIIHLHIRNGFSLRYAKIAKQCGVHRVIAHSHNSKFGEGQFLLKWIAHQCGKVLYGKYVDERLACSDKAARWLFSKKDLHTVKYVNYLVDVERFRFSGMDRKKMRNKYGLEDEVVYLTVGRMCYQKNSMFLLHIFRELAYKDKMCRLVWIGTGEYRDHIHQLAREWELSDRIIFIDGTLEVEKYMSMSDAFLLPSLFEGNPIVVTEAQVSGLPCFISDTITKQAKLLETTKYISLGSNANEWAKICSLGVTSTEEREISADKISRMGYDTVKQISDIAELYRI